jgi:carbon-monoxide dehydrogenase medium subunit
VKPSVFDFHRATSPTDAVSVLDQGEADDLDVKVIAGGQSLVALMNLRLARPDLLVDLNGLDELAYITADDEGLHIGGMTRQRDAERSRVIEDGWPLLSEALPLVAHAPIRNRGTVGGSLAHADPGAELCAVALALDGSVKLLGPDGERFVAVSDLFLGPFMTTIEPNEILTEVVFPPQLGDSGWAFEEVARRKGDFALAGVAVQVRMDGSGAIDRARLAYISLGPKPTRAIAAEEALVGEIPGPEILRHAAGIAAAGLSPSSDIHAGSDYRTHLARVLTERALARATTRSPVR